MQQGKSKATKPIEIGSIVDSIIKEMDISKKRALTTQIRNENSAARSIKSKTTITQQIKWTEDDLDQFGFVIWENCYSMLFQTVNKQCVKSELLQHKSE